MKRLRLRGRRIVGGAAILGATLLCGTGASLAAGTKEPPEHVQSQSWVVKISGETRTVPRNDKLIYCTSDDVESITPKFALSTSTGGYHSYAYHVLNPKGEHSNNLFAGFTGKRTLVERPFLELNWVRAEARETNPPFEAGTYTLEIALNAKIIRGLPTTKMQSVGQELILDPESGTGC